MSNSEIAFILAVTGMVIILGAIWLLAGWKASLLMLGLEFAYIGFKNL